MRDEFQGLQSCQQGDVGVSIIVSVTDQAGDPVNLASASNKTIRLGYPDGTSADFAAAFVTDGSDGQLVYATQDGDLSQVGEYDVQAIYVLAGVTKSTEVDTLQVRENIPKPVA